VITREVRHYYKVIPSDTSRLVSHKHGSQIRVACEKYGKKLRGTLMGVGKITNDLHKLKSNAQESGNDIANNHKKFSDSHYNLL
tara:strand:- start:360 stop:611 length:252 start_codon:yes stop_codon:yes gene_type:complete